MIVATREALRAIPRRIREAAYALGATRWQIDPGTTCMPYSIGGILTGVIIGLSRAIGETAPLVTIGALTFIAFLPESPVQGRVPVPVVRLAQGRVHRAADPDVQLGVAARPEDSRPTPRRPALILLGMTLAMNAVAIWLRFRFRKRINW